MGTATEAVNRLADPRGGAGALRRAHRGGGRGLLHLRHRRRDLVLQRRGAQAPWRRPRRGRQGDRGGARPRRGEARRPVGLPRLRTPRLRGAPRGRGRRPHRGRGRAPLRRRPLLRPPHPPRRGDPSRAAAISSSQPGDVVAVSGRRKALVESVRRGARRRGRRRRTARRAVQGRGRPAVRARHGRRHAGEGRQASRGRAGSTCATCGAARRSCPSDRA